MSRRGLSWLALVAVGVLGAAHVVFWYVPRPRPMETRDARLLGAPPSSDAEWTFWMPYPHQNLPALAGGRDELARWIDAAAAAAGDTAPIRFGPLALPPCRELVVTGHTDGTIAVAADVYPILALFARAAGAVAANPWLAGGSVGTAKEPLAVSWDDAVWTVGPPAAEAPVEAEVEAEVEAQVEAGAEPTTSFRNGAEIGLLSLRRQTGPLPPGAYRIESSEEEIRLATLGLSVSIPELGGADPALLLFAGSASRIRAGSGLAVFTEEPTAEARPAFSLEIPELGVFYRDPEDRWRLPAEGVARLLGNATSEWRGWGIRGWNTEAVGKVEGFLAAGGTADALAAPDLAFLATVEIERARGLVTAVADALEAIPLLGRGEAEAWRDWQRLLEACAECRSLEVVVLDEEAAVRIER